MCFSSVCVSAHSSLLYRKIVLTYVENCLIFVAMLRCLELKMLLSLFIAAHACAFLHFFEVGEKKLATDRVECFAHI